MNGLNNLLYKDKNNKFNTPAFNFDEVVTFLQDAIHLASNKINKIQGLNFKSGLVKFGACSIIQKLLIKK